MVVWLISMTVLADRSDKKKEEKKKTSVASIRVSEMHVEIL